MSTANANALFGGVSQPESALRQQPNPEIVKVSIQISTFAAHYLSIVGKITG
jgi:hypothetical protein